jgi:uncharacterized protein YukE
VSAAERAYAAADEWRALAEAAQDALADAGRTAAALIANNSGAAVDAFDEAWLDLAAAERDGALPRLVEVCRELAHRCDEYAARLSVTAH